MRARLIRVAAVAAAAAVVASRRLGRVEVSGASMVPTLLPGDRLLVVRRPRRLRVGDLVVLPDPREAARAVVKRIVAVDRSTVVVHGDNASASTDSRAWGAVPRASVEARVLRRYAAGPDRG